VRYEPIEPVSRADAERAVSGPPVELARVVIAVALHDADRVWAETFCGRLARHPDPGVRGNALLGLGHLARRFRVLDADRVQPLIEDGLADPDPWVCGQAEAAAGDAETYLGWRLRRPGSR
jgi:hypothetical protein